MPIFMLTLRVITTKPNRLTHKNNMNILQRRMFANGDEVISQNPIPLENIVMNLYNQGLSAMEIQAQINNPNFTTTEIENILVKAGLSIDPTITDYGIDADYTGIIPGPPDFTRSGSLTNEISLRPNLNITPVVEDINVTSLLEDNFAETNDLPKSIDKKTLGPNDIQLSNDEIIDFSAEIDSIKKGGYKSNYFLLYNSPDIKRGKNVDEILELFVNQNEPGLSRLGNSQSIDERRGTASGPSNFLLGGIGALNLAIDTGREALEKIVPPVADFFGGSASADSARNLFEGDYLEKGFYGRSGLKTKTVDDLMRRDFGTQLGADANEETDEIQADLTTIDNLPIKENIAETEATIAENERLEKIGQEFLAEELEFDGLGNSEINSQIVDAVKAGDISESSTIYSNEKTPASNFSQFVQSPDFIRFVRNIGKGLTTTGKIGEGIALGSAAAAEEKYQEEKDAKTIAAELEKEKAKLAKDSQMTIADADKLIKADENTTEAASKLIKSQNTRALMTELRSILNNENPTSIGSFAQGILDQAQQVAPDLFAQEFPEGKPYESLSASLRAKKLATLISQSNIRAILGESSKSISNFDREIVEQLSTQIKLGQPAALNLKSLNELDKSLSDDILANYSTILSTNNRLIQAGNKLGSLSALEILRMYPTLESLKLEQKNEQVQIIDLSGFFE